VQDIVLGPDGQRHLGQPSAQLGGVARLPDPCHVLSVGQPAGGVAFGGAPPVTGQHRGEALRERFPPGGRTFDVGD
jgi:hypothetical protein